MYIISTVLWKFHSVENAEILSHTFPQKFRESNVFTKKSWINDKISEREFLVYEKFKAMQFFFVKSIYIKVV